MMPISPIESIIHNPFASLDEALAALSGEKQPEYTFQRVGGGCIHDSAICRLKNGQCYFVKRNHPREYDNFFQEAQGLAALAQSKYIAVAEPLAIGRDNTQAFLILTEITRGQANEQTWFDFGEQLARMHQSTTAAQFGWHEDNTIGANQQRNAWCDDWVSFFAEMRLKPQLQQAQSYLSSRLMNDIESIIETLDRLLQPPARPQLIHGDLWSGNVMINAQGEGVLIDPAVYYGHGEADIAMTQLFGGFPEVFYQGYQQIQSIAPGFGLRARIYNLYHLLNHLNIFGGGYLSSVTDQVAAINEAIR
ncbi:fructosamine kinase family protein [Suttonella sp. R2A3]|uniref:fructosamine kinase family protein n=1 Tax=Suttonella sp. R2A3 TaxID=2908648 RepID=UPI001F17BA7C|nr:fructosamine kinase family protein [Suttonella sp. R2A3]UJF24463.1 fructosamine kinase family protein [Suttonella sp. R2A3]